MTKLKKEKKQYKIFVNEEKTTFKIKDHWEGIENEDLKVKTWCEEGLGVERALDYLMYLVDEIDKLKILKFNKKNSKTLSKKLVQVFEEGTKYGKGHKFILDLEKIRDQPLKKISFLSNMEYIGHWELSIYLKKGESELNKIVVDVLYTYGDFLECLNYKELNTLLAFKDFCKLNQSGIRQKYFLPIQIGFFFYGLFLGFFFNLAAVIVNEMGKEKWGEGYDKMIILTMLFLSIITMVFGFLYLWLGSNHVKDAIKRRNKFDSLVNEVERIGF